MKTVGIICEYNPFHLGHAYQIEQIRAQERDVAIVCLMSGHATQRGALAVADKFTRAEMALSCGADVVLELPYPYSAASAAYFAGAGVAILDALGVDELCFGSECADLALLDRTAAVTRSTDFIAHVSARQKRGEGSAQAFFAELRLCPEIPDVTFLANDILALEYVRALRAIDSTVRPVPILRRGSAYRDAEITAGEYPSAAALRTQLSVGKLHEALKFVPKQARKAFEQAVLSGFAPLRQDPWDAAALSFFRSRDPDALADIAEMQGGLAHRLCTAARENITFSDMLAAASAKSYPTARLRRAVLYGMTGVTVGDLQTPPAYLSLLGATAAGRGLLRVWKQTSPIPIVSKFGDAAALSPAAARQAALALSLDAFFTLALPTPRAADSLVKLPPRMR